MCVCVCVCVCVSACVLNLLHVASLMCCLISVTVCVNEASTVLKSSLAQFSFSLGTKVILCWVVFHSIVFGKNEALQRTSPAGSPRGGNVAAYVFDTNQPSFSTPFCSVLVSISVFMALSIVFHSINSPDNSPLSHSVLPVLLFCLLGPFNYTSLCESLLRP